MNPSKFVSQLSDLHFENAFNPYTDVCPSHDKVDAPLQRSKNLLTILSAASETGVDSLWLGRDLGYRGGRRTGLALTDDLHMQIHGRRWGISIERPTKGPALHERTAAVVWSILARVDVPVFLWNVFPLHPHEPGAPLSNRSHNSKEREAGEAFLNYLLELLKPKRVVALGNDAAKAAARVCGSIDLFTLRHPSYGGQTKFLKQAHDLYKLRTLI